MSREAMPIFRQDALDRLHARNSSAIAAGPTSACKTVANGLCCFRSHPGRSRSKAARMIRMKLCSLTIVVHLTLLFCWPSIAVSQESEKIGEVQFSRDVLPILSDRCFHCHGPDAEHREADLRLDQRESAVEDLATIVPGDPDASELLSRITAEDPDRLMPPPDSHRKPLSQAEIGIVRRWIANGAEWGKHWAFEKPVRPQIKDSNVNPIDAMVHRRLKDEGLEPSPEADRRTLIRRVTLDLVGSPPTIEEVNAFVADDSLDAYDQLVDRLLASKHYGERMAWPWLDAVLFRHQRLSG